MPGSIGRTLSRRREQQPGLERLRSPRRPQRRRLRQSSCDEVQDREGRRDEVQAGDQVREGAEGVLQKGDLRRRAVRRVLLQESSGELIVDEHQLQLRNLMEVVTGVLQFVSNYRDCSSNLRVQNLHTMELLQINVPSI